MKTFKEFLAELSTLGLNAYRRNSESDIRDETKKSKPDWDKVVRRQKGIGMAISKVRNIDVKVKASDTKKRPWRKHPIKVHGVDEQNTNGD